MSQSPVTADDPHNAGYVMAWAAVNNMIQEGYSWSGRERNCVYLNTGDGRFADGSMVSGLDFAHDARAVALVDHDADGDLDLWIASRTGPRLRFMRNDVPRSGHSLMLRLQGSGEVSRDAIGARVEVRLADGSVRIATLRAGEGFLAQSSKWLHLGLGDATGGIESVTVRWPGGGVPESFGALPLDTRQHLIRGSATARAVVAPATAPLTPSAQEPPTESRRARVVLAARPPLVPLFARTLDDRPLELSSEAGGALLITLWTTWCAPCIAELRSLDAEREALAAAGLRVIAVSCDEPDATRVDRVREHTAGLGLDVALADERLVRVLEVYQKALLDRQEPIVVPTSFLVDPSHRVAVIYRGPVTPAQLREDLALLPLDGVLLRQRAVAHVGLWYSRPPRPDIDRLVRELYLHDLPRAALAVLEAAASAPEISEVSPVDVYLHATVYQRDGLDRARAGDTDGAAASFASAERFYRLTLEADADHGEALHGLGLVQYHTGRSLDALASYRRALPTHPAPAGLHTDLFNVLERLERHRESVVHLQAAATLLPDRHDLGIQLAALLIRLERFDEAEASFRAILERAPRHAEARRMLAEFHLSLRQFPEANQVLADGLAADPDSVVLQLLLGRSALYQGDDLPLARERYARVLARDPENFDAIRETGISYRRERDNARAAEWLDRAHGLRPKDELLALECGFTHLIHGDRAAATRYLEVLRDLGSRHVVRLEKALEGLDARQPPPDSTGD